MTETEDLVETKKKVTDSPIMWKRRQPCGAVPSYAALFSEEKSSAGQLSCIPSPIPWAATPCVTETSLWATLKWSLATSSAGIVGTVPAEFLALLFDQILS